MAILPVTLLPVRRSCVLLFQITSSAHHGCTAVSDNYMAQSAMAAGDLQLRHGKVDDWIIWRRPEWDEIGKTNFVFMLNVTSFICSSSNNIYLILEIFLV